jgi:protein-disulfide isomerase
MNVCADQNHKAISKEKKIEHNQNEYKYTKRIDAFRQWLQSLGKSPEDIDEAVKKRLYLYTDTVRWNVKNDGFEIFGPPNAKIKIVIYFSMTCPLCKRLYNELIDSLRVNSIGTITSVSAVPFTNNESDRLYTAAYKWGKQIALLKALNPIKERITPEIVLNIADSIGIKTTELLHFAHSPEICSLTSYSRELGVAAEVKVTPTFFVNKIRYNSFKDIPWIIDYLEVLSQKSEH